MSVYTIVYSNVWTIVFITSVCTIVCYNVWTIAGNNVWTIVFTTCLSVPLSVPSALLTWLSCNWGSGSLHTQSPLYRTLKLFVRSTLRSEAAWLAVSFVQVLNIPSLTYFWHENDICHTQQLVERLHGVLRPFLLRRLKCDVEKQVRTFICACANI